MRSHPNWLRLGLLASLSLALVESSEANQVLGSGRVPSNYRSWTIETQGSSSKTDVSQFYAPLIASLGFGKQVDLVVSTTAANSELAPSDASTTSMTGNSDVKAQLFFRALDDRVLLQGGVNLPAGNTGLDANEYAVVQSLSHPLLGFRLRHYGEGLNLSGGGAFAIPMSRSASFALGGGFVHRGAYQFLEGDPDFQPGMEISISGGFDAMVSSGKPGFRIDGTYRMFGRDKLDGTEIFEEGDQLEVQALVASPPARWHAGATGRVVHKQDNTSFTTDGDAVNAIAEEPGLGFYARGDLSTRVSSAVRIGIAGEWTRFQDEPSARDNGTTFGAGPTLGFGLGSWGQLDLRGFFLSGTTNGDDENPALDLSGLDVSATLNIRP